MYPKSTNLNTVLPADRLDARRLPGYPYELLSCIPVLIYLSDISTAERAVKWQRDCVVDALEPRRDVRDERNLNAELVANLALVDVVGEGIGDEVVPQVLDVVLGGRLCTRTRVPRNTEDSWLPAKELNKRRNANLRRSCVAAGIGDTLRPRNIRAGDELGETVGPLGVEPVVGREINDDRVLWPAALFHGLDKGLAHAVRERHNPAVYLTPLFHATHVLGREVLIGDVALLVALQFLTS